MGGEMFIATPVFEHGKLLVRECPDATDESPHLVETWRSNHGHRFELLACRYRSDTINEHRRLRPEGQRDWIVQMQLLDSEQMLVGEIVCVLRPPRFVVQTYRVVQRRLDSPTARPTLLRPLSRNENLRHIINSVGLQTLEVQSSENVALEEGTDPIRVLHTLVQGKLGLVLERLTF